MTADRQDIRGFSTLQVIWFSMLMSLAIYLVLGIFIIPGFGPAKDEALAGLLRPFLYTVSAGILIGTWFIRKIVMPKEASQESVQEALPRYATAMLVALAMSESLGIFGLLLFMFGRDPMDLYLLIALSGAAMIIYRPQHDAVISLVRAGRHNT